VSKLAEEGLHEEEQKEDKEEEVAVVKVRHRHCGKCQSTDHDVRKCP